jgi:hypothetical protein
MHPHTQNHELDKDEMHELIELEHMFEKWGWEPLEPNYGVYKPTCSAFKPRKLIYDCTRIDNRAPPPDFGDGYKEFGMDTEPPKAWEFGDTPYKVPYYWNERDLI